MKNLSQISGMPQMGKAFAGWMKNITLTKIIQSVIDGLVTETNIPFSFKGTIQPLNPKLISLKPEGQRAWQWLQVHCLAGSNNLDDNDRIIYNGDIYKVMGIYDYSLNGFIEYHLVKDYQP